MKTKLSSLKELKRFLRHAGSVITLDLETCAALLRWENGRGRPPRGYDSKREQQALSPFHGRIRAISLAAADGSLCLLDAFAPPDSPQKVWDSILSKALAPLQQRVLLSHNSIFDATWLAAVYGLKPKRLLCTLTLSRLLTNGDLTAKNDLGTVLKRELGIRISKTLGETDWSGPLTKQRLQYMANDVRYLHRLERRLQLRIDEARLRDAANLELELLPVVVAMQCAGVDIDVKRLAQLTREGEKRAEQLERKIRARSGVRDLNVGSPIQLRVVLGLPSTNRETLMAIEEANPKKMLATLILKWREAKKLTSTFTKQWAGKISPIDGRVHPSFNPTGTKTGRFSCKEPNVQQAPRGLFREAVVCEPGSVFVIGDLSQIELRAVAAVSGDRRMIQAFREGKDLHAETAAICLGDRVRMMSQTARDEARQLSKQVNFGFSFGMSAKGFRSKMRTDFNIDISLPEAQDFRRRYFAARPGVAKWHARAWHFAYNPTNPCEVRTALGRRRFLPQDPASKWRRFSKRVNTQIQGSCADALKFAMVEVSKKLPAGARLVWTLHDELGIKCRPQQMKQVARLLGKALVGGFFKTAVMRHVFGVVPIQAEIYCGTTWAAKEEKKNKILSVTQYRSRIMYEWNSKFAIA